MKHKKLKKSWLNHPMPDSKSAKSWCFFSILEISKFLGFQNVFPKLHEPSWFLFFVVFPWNYLFFFVPDYTRQILQKIDAKRKDQLFSKLNERSWFLQTFVLENNIFEISYFLFPDWYIHETIHNPIFKFFIFGSQLIHPQNPFRV